MIRKPYLEKADVATAERSHKAYQRRSPTGKPEQIRQKGAIVKERQELEKPDTATSLGADHQKFTELLDGYFKNQSEMKMLMSQIDTHKEVMESKMKELRPMLSKFENMEKAEQKFRTEFEDGGWEYKFLSFTRETKPYKDLYTKAFNLLTEIQREEMKKAEQALSQITGQEKFTREPLAKALRDLVKSYVGKPLTDEVISQFRKDALSLILLKAVKKATSSSEDKEYEKDKEENARPLPKDKSKEKKPVEKEPEDDEEMSEAHQQLLEALKNLISAKESGLLLLKDFFGRKKEDSAPKDKEEDTKKEETPKKESKKGEEKDKDKKEKDEKKDVKKEKSPEKVKDKDKDDDEDKPDSKDGDKNKKEKGKKKAKKDEDYEDESRKSLVEIVQPIILKQLSYEIEKAKEQARVDDFLESFELWEKSFGGGGKAIGIKKPKMGKQEKKDQMKREKEDFLKAKPHKYIKREGVSGGYQYTYVPPQGGIHTNASANRDKAVEMFKVGMTPKDIAGAFPEVFKVTAEETELGKQDKLGQKYDYELADGRKETKRLITADAVKKVIERFKLRAETAKVSEFPSKYFSSDDPHDYEKFQIASFGSGPDVDGFRVEGLHNGRWHSIREFESESQAEKFQDELEAAKAEAPDDGERPALDDMPGISLSEKVENWLKVRPLTSVERANTESQIEGLTGAKRDQMSKLSDKAVVAWLWTLQRPELGGVKEGPGSYGLVEGAERAKKIGPSLRKDIMKLTNKLMTQSRRKGLIENFGQKEVRQLQDKYNYILLKYGTGEERELAGMIDRFESWASEYTPPSGVKEEPGEYWVGGSPDPYDEAPGWDKPEGKTMKNTTHEERMQVAKTILDQMGGAGKIKAMTGAKNFTALPSGVSFEFPSRKGPNVVKITLTPMDTYTVEFGRKAGVAALMSGKVDAENAYKKLSEHTDIYFDQLKELFEDETGLYLSLGVRGR